MVVIPYELYNQFENLEANFDPFYMEDTNESNTMNEMVNETMSILYFYSKHLQSNYVSVAKGSSSSPYSFYIGYNRVEKNEPTMRLKISKRALRIKLCWTEPMAHASLAQSQFSMGIYKGFYAKCQRKI